jgi:hypothetical protein
MHALRVFCVGLWRRGRRTWGDVIGAPLVLSVCVNGAESAAAGARGGDVQLDQRPVGVRLAARQDGFRSAAAPGTHISSDTLWHHNIGRCLATGPRALSPSRPPPQGLRSRAPYAPRAKAPHFGTLEEVGDSGLVDDVCIVGLVLV